MPDSQIPVAIVGGGPAGLMAADVLSAAGVPVQLFDAMPSVGRKFLLAGRGGLNLTHSEPEPAFLTRYGAAQQALSPVLAAFGAREVQAWAAGLGIDTFVGSSGRVFPEGMKAAPLLRAWLHRLRAQGVRFHMRHRWTGWNDDGALVFRHGADTVTVAARAVVLALGGASWSRLGSDGAWVPWLAERGVSVAPLVPANCGFETSWSEHFISRYAGEPLKSVAFAVGGEPADAPLAWRVGEALITAQGIEGGAVYALSAPLRDEIAARGDATLYLDLLPGRDAAWVRDQAAHGRGARSWSSHLRTRLNLHGVKAGLLRECLGAEGYADPATLAAAAKRLPLRLAACRPLDEAISTAGGVRFPDMDEAGMLRTLPGVFCAGEMTDWEAPTGGYLLTACLAQGVAAGRGVAAWLRGKD